MNVVDGTDPGEPRCRYGDPRGGGAPRFPLLAIWQMYPDGDAILAARPSGQDVRKGETAMGQIHGGLGLPATHGTVDRVLLAGEHVATRAVVVDGYLRACGQLLRASRLPSAI